MGASIQKTRPLNTRLSTTWRARPGARVGGSSGSPANSTTLQTLGFTDATDHDVSVALSGLTAGTDYCADLVATNASSTADGGQTPFSAGLPSASTFATTATGATTATVDGSVNPAGQTTTYEVEYDLASSTWCTSNGLSGSPANSTAPQTLGFTDATDHDVTVALSGLTNGTTYCGRVVATNSSGSGYGFLGQVTFQPAPTANTNDVTVTGATTATVDGSVNPVGQTTTFEVQYDLASSAWCLSGEFSGSPANSTAPQTLGFDDATDHDVSVALSGLTPGTYYCADLVAANASGSGDGGQAQFTTFAAFAAAVTTGSATGVSAVAATIAGTVNPDGLETTYHFDYGTTTGYGSSTAGGSAGSAFNNQPVTATLSDLSANTTYHYRLVATSAAGTTTGSDQTFTTLAALAPAVTTGSAGGVSAVAATIAGTVNPNGLATSYHFEYGTSTGYGSSTASASAGSASANQPVVATLTGLSPSTTYHYRLVAANAVGTTDGSDHTFTTSKASEAAGPPTVSGITIASSTFSARTGITLRLKLSEPARITVVITQTVKGHRVRGACKAVAGKGKSCTLTLKKASVEFAGAIGRNSHRLSLPSLRPGQYSGTTTARNAAGRASKPVTFSFMIARSQKGK